MDLKALVGRMVDKKEQQRAAALLKSYDGRTAKEREEDPATGWVPNRASTRSRTRSHALATPHMLSRTRTGPSLGNLVGMYCRPGENCRRHKSPKIHSMPRETYDMLLRRAYDSVELTGRV